MNELFPIAAGLLCGILLGVVTARRRPVVWVIGSIVIGVAATFISGEWKIGWEYLLIDIPLAGMAAAAAFLGARVVTLRVIARRPGA
jgi:hypothetical protein